LRLAPSAPGAEVPAPAPIHVRPLRVLLAEDNPVNSEVARTFLTRAGHTVTLAADGAVAVDKAKDGGFDLILMDMRMPKVDGLEATRRIRALPPPLGNVPIVALTANALRADVERCLDAGMDAHLAKPMTPLALNAVLARVLGPNCAPAPLPSPHSLDVLAAGECGTVTDLLRAQGHRVFAVPATAALTMLGNRPFELVLAPGGADQVAALAQAGAVHRPPPLLAAISPVHDAALLTAGADLVLPPTASPEDVATLVERAAAPVNLGDLLGSAKVDELRGLLLEGLRVHAPALARPGMAADTLAQLAHRLKGSALALGLDALAAAAERALHAAENGGPNPELLDAARQELYTTIDGLLMAAARSAASQG
jgi:CheY-like chemotaxis protein/HPt (histidine-containing phosphotransfer) domain-containing protein